MTFTLFANSILLGIGLAMDAFSVSLANGLSEPNMKKRKICLIAGVFAAFQFIMPLIGWLCVSTVAEYFSAFEKCIPWIALALLSYIGGKMIYEGIKNKDGGDGEKAGTALTSLLIQGIATSIDALSVGFTVAEYKLFEAVVSCSVIGAVTFIICFSGVLIGRKAGTKIAGKAGILGGAILVFIGAEIFITSWF